MSALSFQAFLQQSPLKLLLQQQKSIYLAPNIPYKKALGAQYYLPQSLRAEDILLLVDDTVFGSAKAGLSITADGLYYRADFEEMCYYPFSCFGRVYLKSGLLTHDLVIHAQIKLNFTQPSAQGLGILAELLDGFIQSQTQHDQQSHRHQANINEQEMDVAAACQLLNIDLNQINGQALKQAYRQKMAEFHPDRYQQLPEAVQALIAQQAQQLNQARAVIEYWLQTSQKSTE
jgi:hypothetical protein